ncbi:hypothetical protein [Ponticaulis sp.]|uniref:hypothetical protein n=1 Tax=Ponticaulis sp. TaxID=2020902 RepID=UPI0025F4CEF7|nr:hypothetical protein [Ponticaulis sp.]|tara:strand:+ start:120349 stop:120519 length:171 start_codon:yes stop_codon:yes gene_type:complete
MDDEAEKDEKETPPIPPGMPSDWAKHYDNPSKKEDSFELRSMLDTDKYKNIRFESS